MPSALSALAFAQDRHCARQGRASFVNVGAASAAQKAAFLEQRAAAALHIRKRLIESGALPILLHALAGDGADIDASIQDNTSATRDQRCTGLGAAGTAHARDAPSPTAAPQ